jgi:hypothetical protein
MCSRLSLSDGVDTHLHHARGWIAIIAILALIAGHVWLFTAVSRTHLSIVLISGLAGTIALKFAWWKFRR